MTVRTIPPEAGELSRLKLLWPPAVSALTILIAEIADPNMYSDAGAGVFVLILLWLLVGAIALNVNLTAALPALRRYPSLRSRANLVCTGISLAFVVVVTYVLGGALAYGIFHP